MTTEQVEERVRETLRAVDLDRVRAPGDLVDRVVRRRGRRRFAQAAGSTVAVAAITAGAVLGLGGGGAADQDRPARPAASPQGWKPWNITAKGTAERGCLVDGAALYCAGSRYDAAKFDARTGERQWTVKVVREGGYGNDHPFAVRDGVVYAYQNHTARNQPNGDYAGGTDLVAVKAGTGKVLWKVELANDNRDAQSALLIDGAVLANTPKDRTMSALDPRTGRTKWRHTWKKGIWCERAVLSGVPYLACRREIKHPQTTDVFRLDPATGKAEQITRLLGGQSFMGTTKDRLVLGAERDAAGKKVRLTLVSGSGQGVERWLPLQGAQAHVDVIGDRVISVNWRGEARAYSLRTGKVLWTRPVGVPMPDEESMTGIASPVVSEKRGVVFFLSPTGDLSGLDLRTGRQVWRHHVDFFGKGKPLNFGMPPQLLPYDDVLIARNGNKMISLLPRITG
ncbi:PQQ-binding-like beta-propeller repeat protein [Streptomyces torulosus]|uniref:outer membrane protein assembly factor BamB family protein n=1 Tax=Streptomyces torulosus TaxID=68276 RepID=UPI0006EB6B5E|nr:PQQ-binding-like beta-propeller repeat protein [Streptomyces torulosus]